ncbi:glycosyltransferase [Natrialbaceae archaeon A-gly3]
MRIAFVSLETRFHRNTETNQRLQGIAAGLAGRGHDVHVVCARFWPSETLTHEREGVTYHGASIDPGTERAFRSRLPFVLRSIAPEIIHVNAEPPGQVRAACWGSHLTGAPVVLEWYGDGGVPDNGVYRRMAEKADRIVTPSRLVRTKVRELEADADRVEVIPNPIDVERIEECEPTERVDVVYARRLDEAANVESLLLALAELRGREWSATIVGDGPERGTYERLASDLRIDDRVTFAGDRTLDERIAIYRGAHVFVQTARHCVFPTELLRALAAGCVGIVEYHVDSSAHELVEGRKRGFRTTSEDELASAIVEAGTLEHREFDDSFSGYDRRTVIEQYLRSYRDLIEET